MIDEIQPGEGPKWGTLSGLTAHPTDPSRLYAVTDHDSSPIRILEIQVTPGTPRALSVRSMLPRPGSVILIQRPSSPSLRVGFG